jgi:hypothetical protein
VLETVGFGAGAELVDGAGAGAELGGASVGDGDALCEPDPEPDEPDPEPDEPDEPEEPDEELDELEEREPLEEAAAGCPAFTVGWTPALAVCVFLWCRAEADEVGVPAAEAEVDGPALGAAVAWLVFWTAVRANRVAKPTAVIALS